MSAHSTVTLRTGLLSRPQVPAAEIQIIGRSTLSKCSRCFCALVSGRNRHPLPRSACRLGTQRGETVRKVMQSKNDSKLQWFIFNVAGKTKAVARTAGKARRHEAFKYCNECAILPSRAFTLASFLRQTHKCQGPIELETPFNHVRLRITTSGFAFFFRKCFPYARRVRRQPRRIIQRPPRRLSWRSGTSTPGLLPVGIACMVASERPQAVTCAIGASVCDVVTENTQHWSRCALGPEGGAVTCRHRQACAEGTWLGSRASPEREHASCKLESWPRFAVMYADKWVITRLLVAWSDVGSVSSSAVLQAERRLRTHHSGSGLLAGSTGQRETRLQQTSCG
ncbi:unnamed protein product [Rangifer tarandus platyrhynchus]|uniref:Uncharacterized protein n=1 Tax=Rangifer tarandus platyrhynchus TaxID=3082113 RepID=A0ABN8XK18_RANTA|nr:unnamed protein product [Rangifer tarandus platyrhynchus]